MDTKILLVGLVAGLLVGAGAGYAMVSPQVSTLQSQVTSLKTQADLVPIMQTQITGLTADKTTLQSQLTTLNSQLSTLQTQATTKDAEINGLRSQITTLQSMIPPQPPASGESGSSRFFPAPIGTPITANYQRGVSTESYTAIFTVKEVFRGDAAWSRIIAANQFNSPAPAGYEYILARISFNYVTGPTLNTVEDVNAFMFQLFSGTGSKYDIPFTVYEPLPQFDSSLYPGASYEGWAVFQVSTTDLSPMLSFGVASSGSGGIWLKLY